MEELSRSIVAGCPSRIVDSCNGARRKPGEPGKCLVASGKPTVPPSIDGPAEWSWTLDEQEAKRG